MAPALFQISSLPLLLGAVWLLYFCYRRCLCKPFPGIPYNKEAGYTLLGDIPAIIKLGTTGGSPFEWIASQAIRHGSPITQLFMRPCSRPWIIVSDFEEAQDILHRRAKEFDRSPAMEAVFGGLAPEFHLNFMSADERYREHRAWLRDLMTPAFLNQVAAPKIYDSVSHLVALWSLKSDLANGRPFQASEDTFNIMLDSITAVTFGLDTKQGVTALHLKHLTNTSHAEPSADLNQPVEFDVPPRPPTYEALVLLMDSTAPAARSPQPKLTHWCVRQTSAYRNARRIKDNMINDEIQAAIIRLQKGDVTQRCAIDNILQREMAAAQRAGRQPSYVTDGIQDELFGFLLAGHETTAATMTWGFKYLSENPNIQNLIRSYLDQAFSSARAESRNPTAEEIARSHIPYLDATLEEINRCARIFSTILRIALVDTTVLGHAIPKGTQLVMTTRGASYQLPAFSIDDSKRSEQYRSAKQEVRSWDPTDMDTFNPARWLKTDENGQEAFDAKAGPLLAFGLGPRGCFGKRLAYLQMKMLVVLTLWNLELMKVEGPLGSFDTARKFTRQPLHFYLKLRRLRI